MHLIKKWLSQLYLLDNHLLFKILVSIAPSR